ncbi:uncharacterized protein Dvar_28850 [Desulfosarcina variabilis str. Montpellier]|uniref:hypothetical protein n=1 Tax=Desulfosarcina variabilis TaxID=2300 RepID=UPI003AFA0E86
MNRNHPIHVRIVTITWTNSRSLEVAVRKHGVACYLVASDKMKDLKDVLDHTADLAVKNHKRHNAA